jgi:hypothetical protein
MKNEVAGMVEFTAFEVVILMMGFVTVPLIPTSGDTVNVYVQVEFAGIETRENPSVLPPVTVIVGHDKTGELLKLDTITFGIVSEKEMPVTAWELSFLKTTVPITVALIGTVVGTNDLVAIRAPIIVRLTGPAGTFGVLLELNVKLFGATPMVMPVTTAWIVQLLRGGMFTLETTTRLEYTSTIPPHDEVPVPDMPCSFKSKVSTKLPLSTVKLFGLLITIRNVAFVATGTTLGTNDLVTAGPYFKNSIRKKRMMVGVRKK